MGKQNTLSETIPRDFRITVYIKKIKQNKIHSSKQKLMKFIQKKLSLIFYRNVNKYSALE